MAFAASVLASVMMAGGNVFAKTDAKEAAAQRPAKHLAPIPEATLALMREKGTTPAAPILVRVFKKEAELEVWKRARSGTYVLLKTFPICRWSGQLGPKRRQGDRQAPEGFYAVAPSQMNPNSAYYLSFDTGFPNAYDRANGATGSALMVHGTCSSAGCYAMTDAGISEIYALAREAFEGGQKAFQFHAFPFRMTAENMVKHRADSHLGFWRQLKEGHDRFEATRDAPVIGASGGRYAFGQARDLDSEEKFAALRAREQARMQQLLAARTPAVRTTFADGGQHPYFSALAKRGVSLGEVSQPETLAYAGREIALATQPGLRSAAAALFGAMPSKRQTLPEDLPEAELPEAALALRAPAFNLSQPPRLRQLASAHDLSPVVLATRFAPPLRPLTEESRPVPEGLGMLRMAAGSLIGPAQAASTGSIRARPREAFRFTDALPASRPGGLSQTGLLGLLSMILIIGYPVLQHSRARRLMRSA